MKSKDISKNAKQKKKFKEIRILGEHGHGHWHSSPNIAPIK